jgi:beta-ureidopropionase / N-carbamoyl-L-amino-acid hydrolase
MTENISRRAFNRRVLGIGLGAVTTASPLGPLGPLGRLGPLRPLGPTGPLGRPGPLERLLATEAEAGTPVRVDPDRLIASFDGLNEFGGTPAGGAHRPAYSEADREARSYFLELMRSAGLDTRVDAAGNLLGRREGSEPGLAPILLGSHIDSVPDGGRYDGVVGSIGAVEAARALHTNGITTRRPLEVVIFQNEEGGLYGSRMMSGAFRQEEWSIVAGSGHTIAEGTRLIGGDPDRIDEAVRRPGEVAAFLELHIEQGAVLHTGGIDIGVVEGIVGIRWWDVEVTGFANHAGTTPMDRRQDALLAASRYVDAVNRIVRGRPGAHVGTVGRISASPGAPNVIPGRVSTSLEIRDLSMATIQSLYEEIRAAAEEIGRATGTEFTFELTVDLQPALANERIQATIEASASALGLSVHRMPSGAGHDAQSMARIAPIGMLFVPSVSGVSHSPEELTAPEDMVNGANVLVNAVLALDEAAQAGPAQAGPGSKFHI